MPFQLPPTSRRRFLAGAVAAMASGRFGSRLAFADDADPHAVALLADTHVAADRARVVRGVNLADHLTTAVKRVTGLPHRPAGAFVLGDLALKDGQADDYTTLGELLKPARAAGLSVHLTLGNHDHRDRFAAALAEKGGRPAGGRFAGVVTTPRANLFLLDTLDVTDRPPGRAGGEQLAWLTKALDARTDRPAVVCGHHDPRLEPPPPGKENWSLLDAADLFKVLAPRRHVKAYVYGHTHTWAVKEHASGIHLVNLPPVAYPFAPDQPSGWVHAALRTDGAKLTLHSVGPPHKADGQMVDLKWRT
jgi:3',5'-cyclic AMP phosphodiesterase CpdA